MSRIRRFRKGQANARSGGRALSSRPRSRLRTILDWGLVAVLFGICGLLVVRLEEVSLRTVGGAVRVVDGDTLALDGRRVRLRGIDAFEREQTCRRGGGDYACGREATRQLSALAATGRVECAGRTVDRYGRLLAICRAGTRDLNAAMVESGWALAFGDYGAQEHAARTARRGAWTGEFATPADWRAGRGEPAEHPQDWLRVLLDLIVQLVSGRGG